MSSSLRYGVIYSLQTYRCKATIRRSGRAFYIYSIIIFVLSWSIIISSDRHAVPDQRFHRRSLAANLDDDTWVNDLDAINRVDGTLVLGQHDQVIDEVCDLIPAELDEEFLESSGAARYEQASRAIGTDDSDLTTYYQSHLGASCHDLSALRGLWGDIERIKYVDLHVKNGTGWM